MKTDKIDFAQALSRATQGVNAKNPSLKKEPIVKPIKSKEGSLKKEKVTKLISPKLQKIQTAQTVQSAQVVKNNKKRVMPHTRLTVSLFETDTRALSIIKEKLETSSHDFTTRSDVIKIALRLATKIDSDLLVKTFREIRKEDLRFKQG